MKLLVIDVCNLILYLMKSRSYKSCYCFMKSKRNRTQYADVSETNSHTVGISFIELLIAVLFNL